MRRILIFFLLLLLSGTVLSFFLYKADERSFPEQLEDAMPFAEFLTYVNPDYGYSLLYPSFFTKEALSDGKPGHVRFVYRNNTNLVLEAEVKPDNAQKGNVYELVDSGMMEGMDGYEYYRHSVRRAGHWYVLTLYYPTECKQGVARILYRVKTWHPFCRLKGCSSRLTIAACRA